MTGHQWCRATDWELQGRAAGVLNVLQVSKLPVGCDLVLVPVQVLQSKILKDDSVLTNVLNSDGPT
jgi:hypothetical protein